MVAAFQTVMELSAAKASMVQFAFYGGYATMAILGRTVHTPLQLQDLSILIGLGLYAVGAFLFIPAANLQQFSFFCVSLYVLTFGLAFLETTANPYILSLGSPDNATRRLNLAQAFNPVGSLSGMAIASLIVLPNLLSDRRDDAGQIIFPHSTPPKSVDPHPRPCSHTRSLCSDRTGGAHHVRGHRLRENAGQNDDKAPLAFRHTLKKLWDNVDYRLGVITQVFYVAAQIMVWTFIIQYADNLGIDKATAQNYNIGAMALSLTFRFVGTFFMRYIRPAKLLVIFGIGASLCTLGTILIEGYAGLICLVAISAFMSIMFPSIYGIALGRVDHDDTSLGAAFLVMAIVGGALMPPLQGSIIDLGQIGTMAAVNVSFCLPLICFIVVTCYGLRTVHAPTRARFDRTIRKADSPPVGVNAPATTRFVTFICFLRRKYLQFGIAGVVLMSTFAKY